ncbi:LuxR C-terminal-related transcriptional regulator [Streptomyces griseicoloratus]|uniref:LuxR C-terminal-related transcriptional regulator n=1 Tax=Streptomyces griseicoloratus TaxID=2752516 RepID=UPI00359C827B
MTIDERDARTPDTPWPFTGREDELELVRRSVTAGRNGIVVTGPAGCGKTRLVVEAVRGTDCARVAGTPGTRGIAFAAFAHLLPESVTLHRAVQLLSGVRLLLVDDAHLLDDASAALVHQLAVQGRTRLLVVATDGARVPGAIGRLWTGELLPRLALEPLPPEETARLLTAGAGGGLEPLTADRLHRLCGGDLRLLRELLAAVRGQGLLATVPDTGERAWRGPVPLTVTVRERTAHVLDRGRPGERETLDRLAFAEPLSLDVDELDVRTLEQLESEGLVHVDDQGAARLAHPLHGPVLRAAAGRLRARRLARTPDRCASALAAETAALARRIEQADVRAPETPVGDWLVAEGAPVPAGYAAVRARLARLRGRLREAAAWAREGLRETTTDPACLTELILATAQQGETPRSGETPGVGSTMAWPTERPPSGATPGDGFAMARSGEVPLSGATPGNGFAMARSGEVPPSGATPGDGPTTARPSETPNACADSAVVGPTQKTALAGPAPDAGLVDPAPDAARVVPASGVGRVGPESGAVPAGVGPAAVLAGAAPGAGPAGPDPDAVLVGSVSGAAFGGPARGAGQLDGASGAARVGSGSDAGPGGGQPLAPRGGTAVAWGAVARGDLGWAAVLAVESGDPYDAVRFGVPERAAGRLTGVFAAHADALARGDGPGLDRVAEELERRGFLLFAAEAHAQAVRAHRDPRAARVSRTRAVALARRCEGARTPALSGLVLGELTARQRQIVTLAAAGLSNRQIAERLTLSVRTVGNHLYSAYTRLGTGDRGALPWLVELPETQPA